MENEVLGRPHVLALLNLQVPLGFRVKALGLRHPCRILQLKEQGIKPVSNRLEIKKMLEMHTITEMSLLLHRLQSQLKLTVLCGQRGSIFLQDRQAPY